MKNLSDVVRENKAEAIEIVKACDGRIDFVENIVRNNPDDIEQDDWLGDPCDMNIPRVIGIEYCMEEYAILSVVCAKDDYGEDILKFLAYSFVQACVIGWVSDFECSYHTENEVFMHIGNLVTDDNYQYSTDPNDYHKHFKDADDAGGEIYAIHLNGNVKKVLFDVVEEDFIRMADLNLINTEGNYYLLKGVTLDEVNELRKDFGCCFDDILEVLKKC